MIEGEVLEGNVEVLTMQSSIGFDGTILRGFRVHPDGKHVVYPLGNKVTILHWVSKKQDFLNGHTNTISAIDISRSGKYVASGQINYFSSEAKVILWDFYERVIISVHELHKLRVEAVAFSLNDRYLISLGGQGCGSVIVWDVQDCQLLRARRGAQGRPSVLCTTNRREACFLTEDDGTLLVWRVDRNGRDVNGVAFMELPKERLGNEKRAIMCMVLNERDEICYCGTTAGDVLKIRLNFDDDVDILEPTEEPMIVGCFAKISRKKLPEGVVDLYSKGVGSLLLMKNGNIIIGAGDGTVDLVQEKTVNNQEPSSLAYNSPPMPELLVLKTTNVNGGVTSMEFYTPNEIFVGTTNCELFSVNLTTFETKLVVTCHTSTINDVAFPYQSSDVFATASKDDIRIWSLSTLQELRRIYVPNFICSSVIFSHDGKSIVTAWNDGVIRSYNSLTGRLIFEIMDAHNEGVTALAITHHGKTLISGGREGEVRLWNIRRTRQKLMCTLKEHRGFVSAIHINSTDDEAASASMDGTCIIWDVIRQVRKQILSANTLFMCVRYVPSGVQIMTAGTDRKVAYWEVLDGSLVRELEASPYGSLNCLDISDKGSLFVTGGNDEIVKLWKYKEGVTTHIGLGHSAAITNVCFSPDGKNIISTSDSGRIFVWKVPEELLKGDENSPQENTSVETSSPQTKEPKI